MKFAFRMDITTLVGALLAGGGLTLGLKLEGIGVADVAQLTAALVVFCGTTGAVLVSTPFVQTRDALCLLPSMFRHQVHDDAQIINQIAALSRSSRTRGVPQLEQEVEQLSDPFLRKGLRLAVDNVGTATLARVLDADMQGLSAKAETSAVFYETAAGYAPTLGMAGAAIGLVHVMKHLDDVALIGSGVAAAFVAIVYGVLFANLFLLPIATKIRARTEARLHSCQLMREGALAICAGTNPFLIRLKLESLAQLPHQEPRSSAIHRAAA
jgi:chemotaxis protein MotA